MNKVLLTIIALTLLVSVAGATTDCVTHAPTAYGAYSVVTIDNTQSTATNVSSQQQINLTESSFAPYLVYNNNYANFGYYYQNGTNVTAWIESNVSGKLVTWAKINPSISGISSMDICLGFASTNLLSSSGITGIGEAPQLSSTYAQYDNGGNVFSKYWNFTKQGLPTGWSTGGGGSGAVTVNGGINVSVTTGAYDAYYPDTISSSIVMDELSSSQYVATGQADLVGFTDAPSPLGNLAAICGSGTGGIPSSPTAARGPPILLEHHIAGLRHQNSVQHRTPSPVDVSGLVHELHPHTAPDALGGP